MGPGDSDGLIPDRQPTDDDLAQPRNRQWLSLLRLLEDDLLLVARTASFTVRDLLTDPCIDVVSFRFMKAKPHFGKLSATDFEEFSSDLLHTLDFVNIDWRKGTPLASSPADKGRDIVAHELHVDVDGSRHLEKWFVDCKHFKKAVPPKELDNLLTWAQADRPSIALFIVSGYLSNGAKEHLESYERNNRPPFKIKYWEYPTIDRMVRRKFSLLRKYDLIDTPIRSVAAILKAEEEFFDRIWYDRKLVLQDNVKRGRETIDPEIKKGMLAAMKRVEAKYGGKKALRGYYKSDFEWGMMNGKLSTLRWILGDDWDMLDT